MIHAVNSLLMSHLPGRSGGVAGPGRRRARARSERVEHGFVAQPEALAAVRKLVDRTLAQWSPALAVADVELVAVELATNAIRHAHSSFVLRLIHTGSGVRIEVRDASPRPPACLPPDRHRIGGRGMQIVDSVSRSWGSHPEGAGKVVWAELDVPARRLAG